VAVHLLDFEVLKRLGGELLVSCASLGTVKLAESGLALSNAEAPTASVCSKEWMAFGCVPNDCGEAIIS